jgi:hypothetical protein
MTITADIGDDVSVDPTNKTFSMPIMVLENVWTGDGRFIVPNSLSWRDLPLPTMALTKTTMNHDDADLVGQMTSIERSEVAPDAVDSRTGKPYAEGTTALKAEGHFDTADRATEIARLVGEKYLRGVSIDLGDTVSEYVFVDADGNEIEDDEDDWDLWDLLFGFTADGSETQVTLGEKILSGRIMGATICPFPAFEGAYVTIGETVMAASAAPNEDERWPSVNIMPSTRRVHRSLAAAAAPVTPSHKWFQDPCLDGPTAITIAEDGRVFGHLAIFHECHIGYTDSCVKAPHSASDYAYFHTGCVLCDDGSMVPTGNITMGTGHAELWQGAESAKAHYDNTGTVVCDIAAGDDDWGVWVAGALRPDVDELAVRRLRGAALSGDWRQIGGSLELIAALAVNVPGFPVKRPKARVASGAPFALVAAGRVTQTDVPKLREKLTIQSMTPEGILMDAKPDPVLVAATNILERQARKALRSEVHHDK